MTERGNDIVAARTSQERWRPVSVCSGRLHRNGGTGDGEPGADLDYQNGLVASAGLYDFRSPRLAATPEHVASEEA